MPATAHRWFITAYTQRHQPPFFWIQFQTDVPCHLYCHITKVKPQQRVETYQLRGLKALLEPKWCFVEYHTNEQQEPGDTIQHTFLKPDWPICEYRYFGFSGTVEGVDSPSVSPIFHVHRDPLPVFTTTWLNPRRMDGGYIRYSSGEPHMLHYPADTMRAGQAYIVVGKISWHRAFLRFYIPAEIARAQVHSVHLHLYYLNNLQRGTAPQRLNIRHLDPQDLWQWPTFPLTMSDWPLPGPIIYPFNLTKADPIEGWYSNDMTLPHVIDKWKLYPYMGIKLQATPEDDDWDNYIDYHIFGPDTYHRRWRPDGYYWYARPILEIQWYTTE